MKAIVYDRYGPPSVLRLAEVEAPAPAADEVLVRVRAASVNTADWRAMRGAPFLARLEKGLVRPRPENAILGSDFAGTVEAAGREAHRFRAGDEVFGTTFTSGWSCFAEYVAVPEWAVVRRPTRLSFEEAAAAPLAALTALQALRDKGGTRSGHSVLINGASGGVGTFAVQLAKSLGAEVTGVCSARNHDLVRSIGADHAIDYEREDFSAGEARYDVVVCAVGNRSAAAYARALKPQGTCVVVGFSTLAHLLFGVVLAGGARSATGSAKILHLGTVAPTAADLSEVARLLGDGRITPVIDRLYALDAAAGAIGYVERGRARGKVVLNA